MFTGLKGSYRWIPITETPPAMYLPVLLARPPAKGEEQGITEPGHWDGQTYRSDYNGPVDDVSHWTHFPATPVPDQIRKVLAELPRKGASDGA